MVARQIWRDAAGVVRLPLRQAATHGSDAAGDQLQDRLWGKVRAAAGVEGRWHDNRHTFITDLSESGDVSEETIRQFAGHVSKQMLKHYSHIRMEAKRRAVETLVQKPETAPRGTTEETSVEALQESLQVNRPN